MDPITFVLAADQCRSVSPSINTVIPLLNGWHVVVADDRFWLVFAPRHGVSEKELTSMKKQIANYGDAKVVALPWPEARDDTFRSCRPPSSLTAFFLEG